MVKKLIALLFLVSTFLYGNSSFGTIATGSSTGTYIQLGNDLSNLFQKYKAELKVLETKGSLDNLEILTGKQSKSKASFAIVQNDALEYYRFLHFKDTREDVKEKVKTLLPLYGEHIHIFTQKNKSIKFERGGFLKVAVSSAKSGAAITAGLLENAYGIRFKYVYADFETAQKYLQDGVIDIFIDTISLPSKKYVNVAGLELVELPQNSTLQKIYLPAQFSQKEYPWIEKNISGYKVPSVLVTNLTQQEHNKVVTIFLKVILQNYKHLIQNGHSKWQESYNNRKFQLENIHPAAQQILINLR